MFFHEKPPLGWYIEKKAKVFSHPGTATPFHAARIMEQKIKLMSSAQFYTGYFCMWEVKRSALVPPGGARSPCIAITATASRPPRVVDVRGDCRYLMPFLAKAGQERSYPFTAGQQRKSSLNALELPS